jgi:Mlc titration factor MtfA (ptsG expression regulator)
LISGLSSALNGLTPSGLLVVLAAAAVFGLGFLVLQPVLRRFIQHEVAAEDAVPIEPDWLPLLEQYFPLIGRLTAEQRTRLLLRTRELVTSRHWEGCAGLELTVDMKVVIAAQAALLVLELPLDAYAKLRAILVYPSTFVPKAAPDFRRWVQTHSVDPLAPLLGQAWSEGSVVISWDAALAGGQRPDDGRNVVFHEFAHVLDFEASLTTRARLVPAAPAEADTPSGDTIRTDREVWRELITTSYQKLSAQVDAGEVTVLNEYASTNEQEFFAVATEVFFERPAALKAAYPELHAGLKFFYRMDPLVLHPREQQP